MHKKNDALNIYWKDLLRYWNSTRKSWKRNLNSNVRVKLVFFVLWIKFHFGGKNPNCLLLFLGFASSLCVRVHVGGSCVLLPKNSHETGQSVSTNLFDFANECDPPWWLILACARFESAVYNVSDLVTVAETRGILFRRARRWDSTSLTLNYYG